MLRSLALVGACCSLGAAAGTRGLDDEAVLVQASVQAEAVRQQVGMLKLVSDAMGLQALRALDGSRPHKHQKAAEAQASEAEAEDGAAHKPAAKAHKKRHHKAAPVPVDVPARCTKEDFDAVAQHLKGLANEYGPQVKEAIKVNDTSAVMGLVKEIMPEDCDMASIVSVAGVKWANLEVCIQKATNASSACVFCPLNFMQQVAGKTLFEVPFSCANKCMPVASEAFKCGDESDACDEQVLQKVVPCMQCMTPKLVELSQCAGLPSAPTVRGKLRALREAAESGKESIEGLLKQEVANGREELQVAADSTALGKILALGAGAVME